MASGPATYEPSVESIFVRILSFIVIKHMDSYILSLNIWLVTYSPEAIHITYPTKSICLPSESLAMGNPINSTSGDGRVFLSFPR